MFRTTHTGSLPRPDYLARAVQRRELSTSDAPPPLRRLPKAINEVVKRQVETGLDVVNDGEYGKFGYATYVKDRLTGFLGEDDFSGLRQADMLDHPEFAARNARRQPRRHMPTCTAKIEPKNHDAVVADIKLLKAGAAAAGAQNLFMTAASPGIISLYFSNRYYPTREAYVEAIAEAMRPEYEAIANAGLTLQIDCPDLGMGRHVHFSDLSLGDFRREAALDIEALNHALRNIPPQSIRMHVCWGNYEGPHHRDVPLRDIVDLVFKARPAGIVLESCNPRHGHEWTVFRDVKLPEEKYVVAGVIDTTTNFVEHPDLVKQRILNFASVIGAERVMAGSDCGFASSVMKEYLIVPSITWAKLGSLVEGARLASKEIPG